MMPGTPHGVPNQQPFGKRSAVVRAFAIDGEERIASPRQHHGVLANVSSEHASISNVVNGDAAR
jgi:hypothetical protein